MSTPISHSEKLNYRIQHQISTYAEEMIEHTQSFRPAAFLDLGASRLTSLILRIFAAGELTIRGLGFIGSSDRQLGKTMLKKATIKTLAQVFKLTIISINLIAFVLSYICLLMHQDRLNLSN